MALDTNGLFQFIAGLVPTNLNPRTWITRSEFVHGSPQVFQAIDGDEGLVAFHPLKMKKGMRATIVDYPGGGVNTEYVLNTDPAMLLDGGENSIITLENWRTFWDEATTTQTSRDVVYQYAPNYLGGQPLFPYTSDDALRFEDQWEAQLDKTKSHKWQRSRDSEAKTTYPDPDAGPDITVYDNWTIPIPVGNQFVTGDYIENRFKREDVDTTPITAPTDPLFVLGGFYTVTVGEVLAIRDVDSVEFPKGTGAKFDVIAGVTYDFATGAATVVKTVDIPPRVLPDGKPNNLPTGWTDKIPTTPAGQQLWKIFAHKTLYGNLKSEWTVEKINESPETIRYSRQANPLPSTLCLVTESVSDIYSGSDPAHAGKIIEQVLTDEGWNSGYDEGSVEFIATRRDDGGSPPWTEWAVEKIGDESGEYTDYVYKLFPLNADFDDVALEKPVGSDPSNEGWQDTPIEETATEINYVSKARKFIDGTLKTPWSDPVPYTGQDSFADVIRLPDGNDFKYNTNLVPEPTPLELRMVAELVKGTVKMWQDPTVTLSFAWRKVFDNGLVVDIDITSNVDTDPAYLKLQAHMTAEELAAGYRDNQILVITHPFVTGKAYFELVQTFTTSEGDIIFTETIDVLDISDGIDRKGLEANLDARLILYDTGSTLFVPNTAQISAFFTNLPNVLNFNWYFNNGAGYTKITGSEFNYTVSGNKSTILGITIDDGAGNLLFAKDVSAESIQFAVSTDATDPTNADGETIFSDYTTLTKSEVSVIGEASKVALLTNEAYTAVLDSTTSPIDAFAGELGATGNAQTDIEVFNGGTQLNFTSSEFTVVQASITAGFTATIRISPNNPLNANVYINSPWDTGGARSCKVVLTITVASDGSVLTKEFTVSSTLDAPGATLLDIDSESGFIFDRSPTGLDAKVLKANLYQVLGLDQSIENPDNFYFEWSGAVARTWQQGGVGSGDTSPSFTRTQIWSNGSISCKVSVNLSGVPVLGTATVRISDLTDTKAYRLYTAQEALPNKPIDASNPEANQGVWSKDIAGAIWASDGSEIKDDRNPPFYEFTEPYKVSGEKGDQGASGGFLLTMFQNVTKGNSIATPTRTSSLTDMENAGWGYKAPLVAADKYLWTVQRSFDAFVSEGVPVSFDVNDKPNTQPMAGSQWNIPAQVSGFDGINGDFLEFRYRTKSSASIPPSLDAGSRVPTGWTTSYPARSTDQYVWATKALINGDTNLLETTWEDPTLHTGERGSIGNTGAKGDKGNTGNTGATGATGATGSAGLVQGASEMWSINKSIFGTISGIIVTDSPLVLPIFGNNSDIWIEVSCAGRSSQAGQFIKLYIYHGNSPLFINSTLKFERVAPVFQTTANSVLTSITVAEKWSNMQQYVWAGVSITGGNNPHAELLCLRLTKMTQ